MFKLNVFGWFNWDTIPTLGVQNIMFAYIIKLKLQNSNFLNAPSGPYLYVQFISTKDILKGMVQAPVRLRFPFRRDEFRACRHHHKCK